jgi:hypothetical protein
VVWSVAKGIFRGAARGQMLRTSDYAISLGVPAGFVAEMNKEFDTVKGVRDHLAKNNRDFKALDVYKQFGHAIHSVYIASITPDESESAAIKEKVKSFLKPQISVLKSENANICLNQVSYAYIYALATVVSNKVLDLGFVRQVLKEMLPEEEYRFAIDNAFQVAGGDSEFADNCKDLLPVVQKEIEQGRGEYLVKHVRRLNKDIEAMFSEDSDFDPTKISRKSLLEV